LEGTVGYDPLVINAVESVRDRFGPTGLRSLVELAQREIDRAERAWEGLATVVEPSTAGHGDPLGDDTRQFQAFVDEGAQDDDADLR
jgi:hypothetical protein